jgi:flagellar protein FliO/FliZ
VVSALLLVLALVAGAVYLIKLLSGRRYFGTQKSKGIQVLATRPMGPRQALVLVEVGGRPLLLAQGEAGINLIAEIDDEDAIRRLNDLYGFQETPFEAELHRRLDLESKEGAGEDDPTRPSPSPDVLAEGDDTERAVSGPSPEERLAALRRRRKPGEEP